MALKGGLGNQLFQIGFGLKLSKIFGLKLYFDLSSFINDNYRRTPICATLFPEIEVLEETPTEALLIDQDTLPSKSFLPAVTELIKKYNGSHIILIGYWQSLDAIDESYISLVKNRITEVSASARSILMNDSRSNSCTLGIHFRRSDYKHHGLVGDHYYQQLIAWFRKRNGNLKVYVITDELNSVKYQLNKWGVSATIIDMSNDIYDLAMFAACSNLIIANSSFSFWGALISDAERVYYPKPWSLIGDVSSNFFREDWEGIDGALEGISANNEVTEEQIDWIEFLRSEKKFFKQLGDGNWTRTRRYCPGEATSETRFDSHYVYHTSWAARRLLRRPVRLHVDIGSDLRFATITSAFQTTLFGDYRPPHIDLQNLAVSRMDLMSLPFGDGQLESVSCMHVVEHIGLGRYGDPIDPDGANRAIKELQRVLSTNGVLYFVVPVGIPQICFHAHRVFSPIDIIERFRDLDLIEFSVVDDGGSFSENVDPALYLGQHYACGCFLFKK